VTIQEFLASEDDRARSWQCKGETWQVIQAARPNAGHEALAALAHANRIDLLVTQNVDGLHERSGFPTERLVASRRCSGLSARSSRFAKSCATCTFRARC